MTESWSHFPLGMNINPTEFKAKCLKLIDDVAATHQRLVITKRGKPLVKLIPTEDEVGTDPFGARLPLVSPGRLAGRGLQH
jgi:prevent-host-death family protein